MSVYIVPTGSTHGETTSGVGAIIYKNELFKYKPIACDEVSFKSAGCDLSESCGGCDSQWMDAVTYSDKQFIIKGFP